ncbi:hypothetical protein K469DRAFT_560860, partial [Zopfia rhizophila CBS 207.26]
CYRCQKTFRSFTALDQHIRDSLFHWECPECYTDCASRDQLLNHYRKDGCRVVCGGCNDGNGASWVPNSNAYRQHVRDYNVCPKCERHFLSTSNLAHHNLTHREPHVECYGCSRKFNRYGGMIIHLEAGTCPSGFDIYDLNQSAAMCFQWKKYIDEDFRYDLLNCADLNHEYGYKVRPFKCPTCESTFPKLSSLFMHAGAPLGCSQTLESGAIAKLRRWLYKRHG